MSGKKYDDLRIYTLNGYGNYGNRLQLFALAKIIASYGKTASVYYPDKTKSFIRMVLKDKYFLKSFNNIVKTIKIIHFTHKYIPGYNNTRKKHLAIVGSDQVWNTAYIKGEKYLLSPTYAESVSSYAASIGKCELDESEKKMFTSALRRYDNISVREESAKKALQPLTNTNISVVLDPTLLLGKDEYERLERRPRNIKDGNQYILYYVLGGNEYDDTIYKYAAKHNLNIIKFSDKNNSRYGVEEFLFLVHHAKLVCTDSFHACVFSLIFERPFVAFRRTGGSNYMYTRLRNFINTFKLVNREFNGREIEEENAEVNYAGAKKILREEQEKSLSYLKRVLGVQNEN